MKKGVAILVFLLGLLIFLYPMISRFYYRVNNTRVVADFTAGKETLDQEEINRRWSLAKAYNASLNGNTEFHDPYVDDIKKGVENYARMLEVREKIGVIRIPKLDITEPIFAGTSEEVLQKGVGHMEFTSLPIGGKSTHSVLTGHRGLPNAKIFTDLNKMEIGDLFFIENIKETIAYKVDQIKIIEPHVFEDLYIVPGKDYCTLLTCTPYMINSHRLLVRGERTDYSEEELKEALAEAHWKYILKVVAVVLVAILILALIIRRILKRRRQRRARR